MKKKTEGESPALSFRIDQKLKDFLEQKAESDHRSVSSLVQMILESWAKKQGMK